MSIEFAILGLLSWKPLTGYDLKKIIADSDIYYWSGNNNQIYNSLVALHRDGLVTQQVQYQESLPTKKLYTITEKGLAALKNWVIKNPDLPEIRNNFLIQLTWANMLSGDELDVLLMQYEEEIYAHLRMLEARIGIVSSGVSDRTPRERYLWEQINRHQASIYRLEYEWIQDLRKNLLHRF